MTRRQGLFALFATLMAQQTDAAQLTSTGTWRVSTKPVKFVFVLDPDVPLEIQCGTRVVTLTPTDVMNALEAK